jgi:hypothetical protein
MTILHQGATLQFSAENHVDIAVGTSHNLTASGPDRWLDQGNLTLPSGEKPYFLKVFARAEHPACTMGDFFSHTYEVRDGYPPATGIEGSTAVHMHDPSIRAWATGWQEPVHYGEDVDHIWRQPDKSLGLAEGTSTDAVSLGRGGQVTLRFDSGIRNGEGYDFVVFENAFSDTYLELGFVEVSTDGVHFLRFDHAYLGNKPVGSFGSVDTTRVGGLAGKYRQSYGTPFDLQTLSCRNEVRTGLVDLDDIRMVRILDVVGDGSVRDSFQHVIYDPYPGTKSAGFDLDAVGVIHPREE